MCVYLICVGGIINDGHAAPEYSISRHIQYSFTLQNSTNRVIKHAEFWTYAPVKHTAAQQCLHLETSHPYRIISDDLGNQILHFTFQNLPPYATKIITIKAKLLLAETPQLFSSPLVGEAGGGPFSPPLVGGAGGGGTDLKERSHYLQSEKYIEFDDPALQNLAQKFKTPDVLKTAKMTFNWVANNVEYIGHVSQDRGALYALRHKKGDCTEYMYLFIALCRANNIPARGIGGYIIEKNTILKPAAYHNWAEFYEDEVWKIADPQNKVFMKDQSHYIAMRIISESAENPMGHYHRFRVAGDGINLKMN